MTNNLRFAGFDELKQRFLAQCTPEPNTGCWLWEGPGKVYGDMRVDYTYVPAHRFSYETFVGSIPEGMMACHKCDTPMCVNPEHLFLGTNLDNMTDAIRKGRMAWQKQNHSTKKE